MGTSAGHLGARAGRIRPLEGEDLAQVTELYDRVVRRGSGVPPPGLVPYFERTLLDQPWADPEIPSLVFEGGDDRILGFLGSHVRRVAIDGRHIRMGCSGQLVTEPGERHLGIGARLLASYLAGPQDLTITDGATEVVSGIWNRLGGSTMHPGSTVWTRLFRPWRVVGNMWLGRHSDQRYRRVARTAWPLLDRPTMRMTGPSSSPPGVIAEELTPGTMLEHGRDLLGDAALSVEYDEPFLEWLFREMAAVRTRGTLTLRLLRTEARVLGWYIAYMKAAGTSQVVQVTARRGQHGTVLDRLFADAWDAGTDALEGRLEPGLFEPISRRRCWIHFGARALVHSRDSEVLAAISLGKSALTRLDGEWWMGHHTEPFS